MPQTASLGRLIPPQHVDRLLILLSYLGSLWYQGLVFFRLWQLFIMNLAFLFYSSTLTVRVGTDCRTIKRKFLFWWDYVTQKFTRTALTPLKRPDPNPEQLCGAVISRRRQLCSRVYQKTPQRSSIHRVAFLRRISGHFGRILPAG